MKYAALFAVVFLAIAPLQTGVELAAGEDYVPFLGNLDVDNALKIVKDLSGDQFEGRKSGTRGADMASDYIANYFSSIGLKPAGQDGTYRVQFNVPLWELTQIPTLSLIGSNGVREEFQYRKDFYVQPSSDGGEYSADLAFAGYAITAPDLGYDDYADLSVRGKIILAIIGTPRSEKFERTNYGSWSSKASNALSHGAAGLILVDSPSNPTPHYIERWSGGWTVFWTLTVLRGSIEMANAVLKDSGWALSSLQDVIDFDLKPRSFAISKQLRVSVKISFTQNARGYNVLGLIPGSDPVSSQKLVIVGGHYDHLGKDVDGSIFHGANDNGSGTAVIMEIARVFSAGVRPRSSVLFVGWGGEEEGLFGSRAYVNRPYVPLTRTVAYINLDMVGYGDRLTAIISTTYTSLGVVLMESSKQLQTSLDLEGFSGGSDHASFEERNVPNVLLIYLPLENLYHTPADTADHLGKAKLLETARLTALTALKLADATIASTSVAVSTTAMGSNYVTSPTIASEGTTIGAAQPQATLTTSALAIVVLIVAGAVTLVFYGRRRLS